MRGCFLSTASPPLGAIPIWLERYTLEQAALALHLHAGERYEAMLNRLTDAVKTGALPVYERGKNARYFSPTVREWYEQAFWNDLNSWLAENEPRLEWRFPIPEDHRLDEELTDDLREKMEAQIEFYAGFKETVYNGEGINFRYWVHQMPRLTAAQAARLMSCLDPDKFENLEHRPNRNDPSKLCLKAKNLQRLAEAEQVLSATPTEWLEWATNHGFTVHDGFRLAVRDLEQQQLAHQGTPGPAPIRKVPSQATQTRRNVLDHIIELAQESATKRTDPQSVYAELKKLANSGDRPPPLLGFIEDEGVKYEDSNGNAKFFTLKNLSERMKRRLKKAG
jgi:hypothetical protein